MNLPINPLSPEEQQRLMGQMYLLMGKQVQSYQKHRHMGINTSVPVELAQELMESIEYTVNLVGGVNVYRDLEEALRLGQEILEDRRNKAISLLDLIDATAPQWQTECRWETLRYLRHYLEQYDYLHLSHRGPDELYYPILISPPEGIQGIDCCLFYLNIMWIENQIMAGVREDVLEQLWDRLPAGTLNQCEQLLINGIGKALIGSGIDPLVFHPEEQVRLLAILMHATKDSLKSAAKLLCKWLNLKNENAGVYVEAVVPQLTMWIGSNACNCNLDHVFL